MVDKMPTQNYLMINQSTNVVDNVCIWDGNPDTWSPPADYMLLVQADTLALVWIWDEAIPDWVLAQQLGQGQIGFTWNGTECVTNEPKPVSPK
jgi:hypothetical protein